MGDFDATSTLLRKVLLFIKNSDEYEDPSDMLDLLRKSQAALVSPNPLKRKAPSASDRQAIQSGKVSWKQHSAIELNRDQQEAIIALSDELELNEMECLGLWVTVSNSEKRRSLEAQVGRSYGSLEMNLPTAARELFYLQADCELRIVTELLKARYDSSLIAEKKAIIMAETNRLLRDGKLGVNIIHSISDCIKNNGQALPLLVRQQGARPQSSSSPDSSASTGAWAMVHKRIFQLAECLFFAFYQTQIDARESAELLDLIRELADLMVGESGSSQGSSNPSATATSSSFGSSGVSASGSIRQEWREGLYQVLVVLQLCHVCALDQIRPLYSRHVDTEPYCSPEIGNEIKPVAHSRDGMDKPWKNGMVSGFTCLVFAILREPYVDIRDPDYPASDVVWLIEQASQRQAYSYMRLCMLPVLQALPNEGGAADFQSILMSVLCDLVHNLLTVFCLPVYDDYSTVGFPFPSSNMKLREQVRWAQEENELILTGGDEMFSYSGGVLSSPGSISRPSTGQQLMRDCQDDMLYLLTALITARPFFACPFWVPGKHHPYTSRALDGVAGDVSLIVPSLRFLAALASGPAGCTAEATYTFVKNKHPGRFDWEYFFQLIGQYVDHLTRTDSVGRMTNHAVASGGGGAAYQAISDADTEVLESIVDVLGIVMRAPSVTEAFYAQGFEPVQSLFALLACPVACTLKGSILRALSSLCRGTSSAMSAAATEAGSGAPHEAVSALPHTQDASSAAARAALGGTVVEEIWHSLEFYRLLPITSAMTGGHAPTSSSSNGTGSGSNAHASGRGGGFVGLHYELEAVESSLGMYPVTDGFLSLLLSLFQHERGLPANLGFGHRIPGVVCYVDYVVSEVLMKTHRRQYTPEAEGQGQRWKITSQAVMILAAVIQHYTINAISPEDVSHYIAVAHTREAELRAQQQSGGQSQQQLQKAQADRKRNVTESYSTSRDSGVAATPTSLFDTPSQVVDAMIADFRDESVHFPLDISSSPDNVTGGPTGRMTTAGRRPPTRLATGTSGSYAVPRPKSAGFSTMCHILHHSRLVFDLLLSLLSENSPDALRFCREEELARTCWRSLSIVRTVEDRRSQLAQLLAQEDRERYEGVRSNGDSFKEGRGPRDELDDEDLELPRFGWDEFLYDIPFWRHRTVAAIVGLLHEVCLREKNFMHLVRASGSLTIVRTEKGGAGHTAVLVPVQLVELSSTLTSTLSTSASMPPLCVVAEYIAVMPEPSTCFPSLPVLAVRILQHVASTQTSRKVLGVIADSSSGDAIVSSCTRGLADGNEGLIQRLGQASTTVRRGGGLGDPALAFGQIFTPSATQTMEPLAVAYDYYFTRASPVLAGGGSDYELGGLQGRVEDNVREAVIDLLLNTLMPDRMCLCHYLLGLLENVETVQGGAGLLSRRETMSSFATRGFTMRPGFPANCLDAILDLLSPHTCGISLYHHFPIQANKCFELLYRLCAGPLTSEASLQVLWRRREARNVHFLQPHLHSFLEFQRLSDLLSSGEASRSDRRKEGSDVLQEGARINCLAWTLKILAIELHRMELSPHVPRSVIQSLLSLLFDPDSSPVISTSGQGSAMASGDRWAEEGSSIAQHTISGPNHGSILLLQLLGTLPLSSTFDSDGHDSPVVVQCMQQCSRSHTASQGRPSPQRRNEPPGRFTYVDIRGLALMLQQIWGSSLQRAPPAGRHTSNGTFSSQAEVDDAVNRALAVTVNYNKYNMMVAALANVCQGWRQVVDVALLGCGTVMCGLQSVESDGGPPSAFGRSDKSILQLSDNISHVATAVNRIVNFLVLPTLHILVSQPAMEMVLAEQFARSLLSMTAVLKDVCTTVSSDDFAGSCRGSGGQCFILSEGQHDAMITGILKAILRRGGAHAARATSSCVYRGLLYTSLVHLMCFGDIQTDSRREECSQHAKGSEWFTEHRTVYSEEFNLRCMGLLEPYAVDLSDIAGGDAAATDNDGSAAVSRMSAFSVLSCALSVMGPSGDGCDSFHQSSASPAGASFGATHHSRTTASHRDAYYGSTAYVQCLHTLRDRGHLERILMAAGLTTARSHKESQNQSSNVSHHPADGIMEATLTLCAHLACSSDGTHILADLGVLECVNSLPPVQVPSVRSVGGVTEPSFSIATADIGDRGASRSRATAIQSSSQSEVEIALTPLLRLLRAMASSSPSVLVLKHCATFMVRNQPVLSFFLRLHSPSLKGLRIVHTIVSIMCMIAPATLPQHHQIAETKFEHLHTHQSGVLMASLWEMEMGPKGDSYTADLCRLGRVFGAKPTRQWSYVSAGAEGSFLPRGKSGGTSWWNAVTPASAHEEAQKDWLLDAPLCLRLLGGSMEAEQWTKFDALQFTLGLQILERISSFFRIRSNLWINLAGDFSSGEVRGQGPGPSSIDATGMLAVDMEDLMYTFQSCACFYLRISDPSAKDSEQNSWLMDPDAVSRPSLCGTSRDDRGYSKSGDAEERRNRAAATAAAAEKGAGEVDREVRRLVLHSTESLFCAVYDIAAASSPAERISWVTDITTCLQIAESFPPHSFVRQVARCLDEIVRHPAGSR